MQDNIRKPINTDLRKDVPKYENNIMRSRSTKEVKYNGGGFGDLEDTSDIKHSYSFGTQKMNGMNNMNTNYRKERNSFSSGSHSPKYVAMKQNRFSQGDFQGQGYSPRVLQISPTNRGSSRPPTSPSSFSPNRSNSFSNYSGFSGYRYQHNNRSENVSKMQRPLSSPVHNKWNTGMNPIKSEEFTINTPKKKSSAIDIIDPETNKKKEFNNMKKINETSSTTTNTPPSTVTAPESTTNGTETPVNDVVDTNNAPLETSQVFESDNTETAVESSDLEEEQVEVKSEVINNNTATPASNNENQNHNGNPSHGENNNNNSHNNNNHNNNNHNNNNNNHNNHNHNEDNNKKSENKNKNQQKQKQLPQPPQPNIEDIINQRPLDDSKYENKLEIDSFGNVKYPEKVDLPVVDGQYIKYTAAFIMLFKELCPRKTIDIKFIYDSINNAPEKTKKTKEPKNKENKGNKKNKNNNNNNNNNNNDNNNNNNKNQNERSNSQNKRQSKMGKRNESNQSSRRGVGRSFSRRQQPQDILPPVKPLEKSENAWKMVKPSEKNAEDLEVKLRKVKGILNKLTLEKFKVLADQIVDIGIKDEETLKGIIKEIFDKAIDEPNFGSLYAKLCQYINEELPKKQEWVNIKDTNNNVFRKLMLNRCQEEFESNKDNRWSDGDENEKPVSQMTDEEKLEYSKRQSERTKKKRRSLGNIRFIGELYMCQMITQKIIRFCFWTLFNQLKNPDEESVECLCFLFKTVGNKVENQLIAIEKGNNNLMEWNKEWKKYFNDISVLSKNKAFPSRMRFMLMDIIELRKNKWKSKETGPKTIAEIHKEAEKELKEQEIQRNNSRSGSGRSNSNRSDRRTRRSESMRDSILLRNTKLDKGDLNSFGKLEHNNSVSNQFFGPQSGKNGRNGKQSNSSRENSVGTIVRQSTMSTVESPLRVHSLNIFDALNDVEHKASEMVAEPSELQKEEVPKMNEEKAKKRIENTYKEYVSQRNLEEALLSIKEIGTDEHNKHIVNIFIDKYSDAKSQEVDAASELIVEFYKNNVISSDVILKEIQENAEFIEDMIFDIPDIYKFYGIFLSKLISVEALSLKGLNDICEKMKNCPDVSRTGIPPAARLAGNVLGEYKKNLSEDEFIKAIHMNRINLKKYWYDHFNAVLMVDWIKKHHLEGAWNYVKDYEELMKRIGVDPAEEVLNYIRSSIDQFTQDSDDFGSSIAQIIANDFVKKSITENDEQKKYIQENALPLLKAFVTKEESKTEVLKAIEPIFLRKRKEAIFVELIKILKEENFINKTNIDNFIGKCQAPFRTKALYKEIN